MNWLLLQGDVEGVHQAASFKLADASAKRSDVARLLGTSSRLFKLKEGRARFWAFIGGKIKDLRVVEFRGKMQMSASLLRLPAVST